MKSEQASNEFYEKLKTQLYDTTSWPSAYLFKFIIQTDQKKITNKCKIKHKELSKHWSVDIVNGEVSSSKRSTIFNNFQNAVDPHVLIAHPATMAHGLTLTAADTIVWYGPITSNEQYVQAKLQVLSNAISNVLRFQSVFGSALCASSNASFVNIFDL